MPRSKTKKILAKLKCVNLVLWQIFHLHLFVPTSCILFSNIKIKLKSLLLQYPKMNDSKKGFFLLFSCLLGENYFRMLFRIRVCWVNSNLRKFFVNSKGLFLSNFIREQNLMVGKHPHLHSLSFSFFLIWAEVPRGQGREIQKIKNGNKSWNKIRYNPIVYLQGQISKFLLAVQFFWYSNIVFYQMQLIYHVAQSLKESDQEPL